MTDRNRNKGLKEAVDPAGLASLLSRASRAQKGPAPVEKWNPQHCGKIDMEIRADGSWFYMGTPIGRPALVELFSSVLRKDEDGITYLVTPVEKVEIRVADAHFIGVEMHVDGDGSGRRLTVRTNVGDVVEIGRDNPLRFVIGEETGGLKPYLLVRGRLEALLSRALTYELVSLGEEIEVDGRDMFAIRSGGEVFAIMPADELNRLSG
ncbi:DUF1285 domain-containing protein [Limoniibacter endophyticus]|nr:DUF1285 domain-containing protein [Limoniibacter endophyticus]